MDNMKQFLLGVLLLTAFACNTQTKVSDSEGPEVPSVPTPTLPVVLDPITVAEAPVVHADEYTVEKPAQLEQARGEFTVKIVAENYTPEQSAKLEKAEVIIKKIANSQEYKDKVLKAKFTNTKGMSNEQIYNHLLGGAEALIPLANYQMDLRVKNYYSAGRVVGYTTAKSLIVNTNTKFHKNFTPCRVASNLFHEWTHKMGFDHVSAKEHTSIPYMHNDFIEDLCALAEQDKLTKIKPILLPQSLPQ